MANNNEISSLSDLLERTKVAVDRTGDYQLNEDLRQIRRTYASLLHFLASGSDDPNSTNIYKELGVRVRTLADRAARLDRLRERKSDKYCLTFQQLNKGNDFIHYAHALLTQASLIAGEETRSDVRDTVRTHAVQALLEAHEVMAEEMFEQVWTGDTWEQSEVEMANRLLEQPDGQERDQSLLVSAVTLSLHEMYDERKVAWLIGACAHRSAVVAQRALVGLLLSLWRWDGRVAASQPLSAQLSLLFDEPGLQKALFRCMTQLQHARLTEKLTRRITNDIIPDLLKAAQFRKEHLEAKDLDEYLTRHGENREWHQNDEQIQARMEEMAKMEMEGGDVYMATFSRFKGMEFFRQIGHWFLPFDPKSPLVAQVGDIIKERKGRVLRMLLGNLPACDSDKYSFALMMSGIGNAGRNVIAESLEKQIPEEAFDEADSRLGKTKPKEAAQVSRYYIYDLYRFFTLYPYHQQFRSPFAAESTPFSPLRLSSLAPLRVNTDEVRQMADAYMRLGFYQEALDLFLSLQPQEREADVEIWQRIAFCEEKLASADEAYAHYSLAYRLNPGSDWTLRKTANAAFQLRLYDEAFTLYSLLQASDENNMDYLQRCITCKIRTEAYADALPLLYKAAYLSSVPVFRRQLVVCLICCGDVAKAREQVDRLMATADELRDNLFYAGAVSVAEGHTAQAYQEFLSAYSMDGEGGSEAFAKAFANTKRHLRPLGAEVAMQMDMIYDAIVHAQSLQQE